MTSDPGADNVTNDIRPRHLGLCTLVLTTRVISYKVTAEKRREMNLQIQEGFIFQRII